MKLTFLVLSMVFVLVSCAPQSKMEEQKSSPAGKSAEPAKKSIARETINGFTGKTAVDRYKETKEKIAPANERGKQSKADIDLLTK